MMGNWEDWLMGASLAGAVVVGMALHNISGPELTSTAIASEEPAAVAVEAPALVFTVTGKRMPSECKGEVTDTAIAARCEALRDQTTVDVKPGR